MRSRVVRRLIGTSTLLAVAGVTVSGGALTVGALGAGMFFRRGSLGSLLFIAITVLLAALIFGWAASPAVSRLLAGQHRPTARERVSSHSD